VQIDSVQIILIGFSYIK